MPHRVLETEADVETFARFLAGMGLPLTVEWTKGRDRSADQNALMWLWASESANQLGDRTPTEMQHYWKLHYGVPILREDSAEFRAVYDTLLKPLPYEAKLKLMAFIGVTSEMKVRQMVRFLDAVQRECLSNGLEITDPDPALASYQQRYRVKEAA